MIIRTPLLLLTLLLSQTLRAGGPVTIQGTITNKTADSVYLVSNVRMTFLQSAVIARSGIDAAGHYGLQVTLENPTEAALFVGKNAVQLFVEPGYDLEVSFTPMKTDSTLKFGGTGGPENTFLHSFNSHYETPGALNDNQVHIIGLKLAEFNHYNDSLRAVKENFLKQNYPGKRSEFVKYIHYKIDYFWGNTKIIYPRIIAQVKGMNYDTMHLGNGYYDFLTPAFVQDQDALESNMYVTFLSNYQADFTLKDAARNGWNLNLFYQKQYDLAKANYSGHVREVMMSNIVYQKFQQDKSDEALNLYEDCRKSIQDTALLNPVLEYVILMHRFDMGKPFPRDLVLTDSTGMPVNISNFAGKLVFIDFWASWCGPCRGEMPYSRKLIDHFKGKEVVFLFISIDQDGQKWKQAMRMENLDGVHATSPGNWNSPVCKALNVTSIPRYMLLDRKGNFIDNNAPRPSNGAQQLIEEFLNK